MESLHDDEAKTTSNEDRRQSDAPDKGGFWGHGASDDQNALPDEELQEPEPVSVEADADDDSSTTEAAWLSLSRSVDTRASRPRSAANAQPAAQRHPMTRGGRVVVRGPVEGLPPEQLDEPDYSRDTSAEDSLHLAGSVYATRMGLVGTEVDFDLDEPPMMGDDPSPACDPYLPPDVYVEENPYDLAMSAASDESAAQENSNGGSRQVWMDVEYEPVHERAVTAQAEELPNEPVPESLYVDDILIDEGPSDVSDDGVLADDGVLIDESDQLLDDVDEAYAGDLSTADRIKTISRRTRITIAAVVLVVVLLIVYIVGITQISGTFLPRTTIGECDISGLTQEQAEQALTNATENYMLTITVGNFSTGVMGESVSIDRDEARIAREAYEEQSVFAWPLALLFGNKPDVDQEITYDNVKFDKQVDDAVDAYNQENLPATNVQVAFNEASQTYSLKGSVDGKALDKEEVLSAAHGCVATMKSSCTPSPTTALRDAELDDLPQYYTAVTNANTVRDATIPIMVENQQVTVCDPLLIRSWVTVSDEPAVVVDTTAIRAWTEKTLSPLVYKDGEWGEVFLDVNLFVNEFSQRLKDGEPGPFEAVTYDELNREGTSRQQAYEESPWNKKLGRYIDVDLAAQFARLFDSSGKVIWESAFVSGDMYEGHQTITGTYQLYAHLPGQVLVGLDYNGDGQPDYESYVNFWMPFYGGYGLHDATWRDSFGGDLYVYNGSHGCINLPYDKAEELYNMTSVGDTVYVHE